MALLGLVAPLSLAVLPTENARIETVIGRVAGVLRAILVDDGVGKFLVGDPLDPRAETLRVSLLSVAQTCKVVETRNLNRLDKAGMAFTAWQDLRIGKTGDLPTSERDWTREQADVVREGKKAETLLLKTVWGKVEVSASTLPQPVPGSTVPVCPLFSHCPLTCRSVTCRPIASRLVLTLVCRPLRRLPRLFEAMHDRRMGRGGGSTTSLSSATSSATRGTCASRDGTLTPTATR